MYNAIKLSFPHLDGGGCGAWYIDSFFFFFFLGGGGGAVGGGLGGGGGERRRSALRIQDNLPTPSQMCFWLESLTGGRVERGNFFLSQLFLGEGGSLSKNCYVENNYKKDIFRRRGVG